jgi:eukaryotic-like serine/threonine-protein kinase
MNCWRLPTGNVDGSAPRDHGVGVASYTPVASCGPDARRWRRAREVFDAIVDLAPSDRQVRLDVLCGSDPDLRLEVTSLLVHDRLSHATIERVVADAAADAAGSVTPQETSEIPSAIGRYRILAKLGEGGMGEVFLAEDASLGRRVALKVPPAHLSGDPWMRQRLQQEARASATLNHPHVCVVHEVGEDSAGRPFIAMEYVEGETLAARIRRGPLPAAEVFELGRQAAGALYEAHAQGVVHRDLKPSNIMLTAHGIKLLDFGLASVARDAVLADAGPVSGGFMGTIPYMSPEQVRSEAVDHRTDLFSLGAVLYEAATGRLPFDAPTPRATCEAILAFRPVPPSRILHGLPAAFDGVIARALAKDREARYQSADALRRDLTVPELAPSVRVPSILSFARARGFRGVLALLAVVTVTVVASRVVVPGRPVSGPRVDGTILLADFANATGDPAFDGTLQRALVVQLRQTPFLHVFPEAGVRETLRQMTRASDARLSAEVAQEISRRRGIQAWISGSIEPAGRGFAITLVATSGESGEVIAQARVEADAKVQVLPALGTAATRLRQTLGESLRSLQQFDAPIQQATTASLDALKAYALGAEQAGKGNYPVAVSLYERAVQLDPEFAMAYQALARERLNSGYSREVVLAAVTRAYRLRARTTEQEKFGIEALYQMSVEGALERAIETELRWKETYPLDWRPYHALGDLYNTTGQYAKAVEAAQEAVRLNPDVAAAYSNLAGSLFALDRFEEAREVYRRAMARGLDAPEYHAFLWRIAYYLGDADAMQRQLDWAAASSTWAFNMASLAAALQGRWVAARHASQQAIEFFDRRGLKGFAALAARYDAVNGALVGDCGTSRRSAAQALGMSQTVEEEARTIVALALCGDTRRAPGFAQRLREHPQNTMLNRVWLPVISAATSLGEGRPAQAVDTLRATIPYEGTAESLPVYLRGLALLRTGAGTAAEAEFQKIIDHRGRTFWFPFHPLAHLGLARALVLRGDTVAASRAYQAFFTLWKDADADLPVLVDARREYARLRPN